MLCDTAPTAAIRRDKKSKVRFRCISSNLEIVSTGRGSTSSNEDVKDHRHADGKHDHGDDHANLAQLLGSVIRSEGWHPISHPSLGSESWQG